MDLTLPVDVTTAGLLEGLIGAIIGGAVTAWAVILTLRHERGAELRGRRTQAAADLLGDLQKLRAAVLMHGSRTTNVFEAYAGVLSSRSVLSAFVAESRQPFFEMVMGELGTQMMIVVSPLAGPAAAPDEPRDTSPERMEREDNLVTIVHTHMNVIHDWIAEPRLYRARVFLRRRSEDDAQQWVDRELTQTREAEIEHAQRFGRSRPQ